METKLLSVWIGCFILAGFLGCVSGNGRMLMPPQRSSLWRDPAFFRFRYIYRNYNDHTLNCGGFWRMHQNNGKCGVCGDPWDAEQPRPNEAGGIYARGIIGRTYSMDKRFIDTVIQVTSSISGYFEFNICPNDDVTKRVSRECLDNFPMRVLSKDRSTSYGRRYIPDISAGQPGVVELSLEIPDGLECTQCVLQWRWHGANNYGICRNGRWGKGCGEQPEMYNCADIAILPDDKIDDEDREQTKPYIRRPRPIIPSPTTSVPTPTSTQAKTTLSSTTRPTSLATNNPTTIKESQPTKPTTSKRTTAEQTTPIRTTSRPTTTTRRSTSTTTTRPTTITTSPTTLRQTTTTTTTEPTTTRPIRTTTTASTTTTVSPKTTSYSQSTSSTTTPSSPLPTTMRLTTDYVDITSPTASSTTQYVPTTPVATGDVWTPTTEKQTTINVQSTAATSEVTHTLNITIAGNDKQTTPVGSTLNVTGITDSQGTVDPTSDSAIFTVSTTQLPVTELVDATRAVTDKMLEHTTLLHTSTPVIITDASTTLNDTSASKMPISTERQTVTGGNVGTTVGFEDSKVIMDTKTTQYTTVPDVPTTQRQTTQSTKEDVRSETNTMPSMSVIVPEGSKIETPTVIIEQSTSTTPSIPTTTIPTTKVVQSNQTPSSNNAFSISTLEAVTPAGSVTSEPISDVTVPDTDLSNTPLSNMNPNTFPQITAERVTVQPVNKTARRDNEIGVTRSTQGFNTDNASINDESMITSNVKPSPVLDEAEIRTTTQVVPEMISDGNMIIVLDPKGASETIRGGTIEASSNTSALQNSISAITPNQNITTTDSDLLVGLLNEILNIKNRSTPINVQPTTLSEIFNVSNKPLQEVLDVNSSFDKREMDVTPPIVPFVEQSQDINTITETPTVKPIASNPSEFEPSGKIVTSNSSFGKRDMDVMPTIVLPVEQPQVINSVTLTPAVNTPISSKSAEFGPSTPIVATNTSFGKRNMDAMPPIILPVEQSQEVKNVTTTTPSVPQIFSNSSNLGPSGQIETSITSSDKRDTDAMPPIVLPVEQPQELQVAVVKRTSTVPTVTPTSSDFVPSSETVASRSITFTGSAGGRLGGGRRRASLFPISRLVDINFNIENGEANREKRMQG